MQCHLRDPQCFAEMLVSTLKTIHCHRCLFWHPIGFKNILAMRFNTEYT